MPPTWRGRFSRSCLRGAAFDETGEAARADFYECRELDPAWASGLIELGALNVEPPPDRERQLISPQ